VAFDFGKMDSYDRELLLSWFLHHMPMGTAGPEPTKATRYEFMREFPAMYNRYAGREIVRVQHLSSDTPA